MNAEPLDTVLPRPRIRPLEPGLIDKIAAGEVVERPASVVKELVENSLDAGASRVTVRVADGGRKLIQVSDDGHGIEPGDLELAVSRHATSKIASFDDLYRLRTNGFRGEALASIAGVSQFTLASYAEGHEPHEIEVHGGRIAALRPCAHARGTTATAKYLFYQTPARLKFLRGSATEMAHIAGAIHRLALSHPDAAFRLNHEDRTVFDEPPCGGDAKRRVLAVLGGDLKDDLYPFSGETPGVSARGWLAHPQVSRSQRTDAYFFVNGRSVNDKLLWHAVMEAHRDVLMRGRYPVIVLNLEVPEEALDVNVHPTKSEVRFHHSRQVHGFVKELLRGFLSEAPWKARSVVSVAAGDLAGSGGDVATGLNTGAFPESSASPPPPVGRSSIEESLKIGSRLAFGRTPYASMRPLGQIMGTYIVCESADKLVLIDQHAAHERVGFEKLVKAYGEGGIPREPLLIPETVELKPSDAEILKQYLDELQDFGLEVDELGGATFAVKAVPALTRGRLDAVRFLQDIAADVKETGELVSLKNHLHKIFATLACHGQIRANHHLVPEEIAALLNDLERYQFTDFCPHGRPVAVDIARDEIEKWFKRVL